MLTYKARWASGDRSYSTRTYKAAEIAWYKLAERLYREGINAGPWHMPGQVAGDVSNSGVARANGEAYIITVERADKRETI